MGHIKKDVTVKLADGIEPRQTAMLVQRVCEYSTESINIDYNGKNINPKSLMASMYLAAPEGTVFSVSIDGPRADEAMKMIEEFLAG